MLLKLQTLMNLLKLASVDKRRLSVCYVQCSHNQILNFLSASSTIPQFSQNSLKAPNEALNQSKSWF